jgi:hypothetical protein
MIVAPMVIAGLATLAGLGAAGWAVAGADMAGPLPGHRMSALVPQLEVTLLFSIGLVRWSTLLSSEAAPALGRALAVAPHGYTQAVARAVSTEVRWVIPSLLGSTAAWLLATLVAGGPRASDVYAARLLLVAFAVFGIGLGAWASSASASVVASRGACLTLAFGMAAAPFAVAPLISVLGGRPELVQATVMVSPWILAAGASGFDILRAQWMYALSPLGSVEMVYPATALGIAVYASAGLLLIGGSRIRLAGRRHPSR